ncbi:MAG TPA: serine/threonine-protein kinase [bacterium]|nr:serine/threonine-protein kinase [bacterium]
MRIRDFGGYKLQDLIGGGMYTKVYKAHSFMAKAPYGQMVAIKLLSLKDNPSETRKLISQFEREAEISMSLNHPNVVKVHNFGRYNNQYAIIMEYVNGSNFKEALYKREKLPLEILLHICYEAGKGLAYIHKNDIVHKDVKPDNILVSEDYKTVKITDFGIAKLPKRIWHKDIFPKSGTVTKFGIISYIAPEQTEGNADFCSDIYSFGVTMDEVLTAKLLIDGQPEKNSEDYFKRLDVRSYRKKTGRQDILCEDLPVPEILKGIIRRATSYSCGLRHSSMEELLSELEKLL